MLHWTVRLPGRILSGGGDTIARPNYSPTWRFLTSIQVWGGSISSRYVVYDKYGDYKDTLLVDERGEVCYAGDDVGGSLASSSTPPRMSQWHRIDSYASWRWVPLKPWDSRTHLPPELYHGGWFDANHFLEVDLGTKTVRLCRPRAGIYTKMQSLDIIKRTTLNTKPISSVQNNRKR